jgi:multimeric flavodoxin WrbA
MKVLGIVGSPRKRGNTHVLVSRILEGAREKGASVETVLLRELSIQECDGCHACWKGNRTCIKHDDMEALYPKIAECNAIVLGTPVYWFGPTALMKCFIDRFVYFNCPDTRNMVRGKLAVIAIPFEDTTLDTADLVVGFFEKSFAYMEMKLLGEVLVPGVTKRGEVRNRKRIMDKCYRLGQKLATAGSDRSTV